MGQCRGDRTPCELYKVMKTTYSEREKALFQDQVQEKTCDFSTRYLAVYHLQCIAENHPGMITSETIAALQGLLRDPESSRQRSGFFLCRLAADALASIIVYSDGQTMAHLAFSALKDVLGTTTGHSHRVSAEALGALPISIHGPELTDVVTNGIPCIRWKKMLDKEGLRLSSSATFFGRSLVARLDQRDRLLVIKFALAHDSPDALLREALWIEHLRTGSYTFPCRFDIPVAIKIDGSYVFRLKDIRVKSFGDLELHPKCYAVAFIADKDYFTYPGDSKATAPSTDRKFSQVMFRNAWLLGRLSSLGIIHSAPIPLFHNRVQRGRRRDNGLYEWFRAGRLDRWLDSCSYPNIGLTGIRDFEHLISFNGHSRELYRHIGRHMLSLLLVAGSYFRNKNRSRVGLDEHGRPVDARDLFDKPVLKDTILGVFLSYYEGFVQREFKGEMPLDLDRLAARMIDEMGVDRHMEEILRIADQKEMTDEQFRRFLKERGRSDETIGGLKKGIRDIVVLTGPHLGAFNQRISLPELVESVETMAALCITGRWRKTCCISSPKHLEQRKGENAWQITSSIPL
jgi:hypothetical protein